MDSRYRELDAEIARLQADNEELRREVVDLRGRLKKLTAALEEARRGGKRQAAPFRKGDGPKPEPKKPGRK